MIVALMLLVYQTAPAKPIGTWSTSVYGLYSAPTGNLSDWFKSSPNLGLTVGQKSSERWTIEGVIEYSRYDRENLTGYAKDKLELELTHWMLGLHGKHDVRSWGALAVYYLLGGGIYNWEGIRGSVAADSTIDLPAITERRLSETNWGAYTGMGLEWAMSPRLAIETHARYRFVVGDLWPTMQPYIELEGVSGFQTLNLGVSIRYYLK